MRPPPCIVLACAPASPGSCGLAGPPAVPDRALRDHRLDPARVRRDRLYRTRGRRRGLGAFYLLSAYLGFSSSPRIPASWGRGPADRRARRAGRALLGVRDSPGRARAGRRRRARGGRAPAGRPRNLGPGPLVALALLAATLAGIVATGVWATGRPGRPDGRAHRRRRPGPVQVGAVAAGTARPARGRARGGHGRGGPRQPPLPLPAAHRFGARHLASLARSRSGRS